MAFVVYNYPPNGPRVRSFVEDRLEFSTLGEARRDVKRRLGKLDRRYYWSGYEASHAELTEIEAYHESNREGSGGVQISLRKKLL